MISSTPTVLLVDDEPDIIGLFSAWLECDYDVLTATSGQEAIDQLDDSVDVVLLDRMMEDISGDEILECIRERGHPCRVAMVTAVEPDFDVIEMGFDDYVTKPVNGETLRKTVEELLARKSYDEDVQELYALASKKATLEAAKSREALESDERYLELVERVEQARTEANRTLEHSGGFQAALRDI